jgi:hypothetical protein
MSWVLSVKARVLQEKMVKKEILLNQINKEVFKLEQELEKMELNQQIVGESLKRDREKMGKMGYIRI